MKIVKLHCGSYAIRKYWFFGWRFVNHRIPSYTESWGSPYFNQTKMSRDEAIKLYNLITNKESKYKVVKLDE